MKLVHEGAAYDVAIETITPEKAHQYLSCPNGKQTKGRSGVSRYAEDMRARRWRLTGETIIFNSKGQLDNGYSRLSACVDAGLAFTTFVVRGIDAKSFDVLDIGKTRSLADLLRFKGKDYVNTVAYSLKRLAARDKGVAVCSGADVTRQEEIDALRKYPHVQEYARKAQVLGTGVPHALLGFVWFLFGEEYPVETAEFFRAFAPKDGDPRDSKHPAYKLADKLREQHSKADRIRYSFFALNAFIAGQRPRSLQLNETDNTLHIGTSGKSITIS